VPWTSGANWVAAQQRRSDRRGTRRDVLGAVQLPSSSTGPRKPYPFGDAANGVDVWFADLGAAAPTSTSRREARRSPSWTPPTSPAERTTTEANGPSSQAQPDRGQRCPVRPRRLRPDRLSVWDGGSHERGNKRLEQWQSLYIEPQVVVSAKGPAIKTGLLVFGLELLVIFWVRRKPSA
jgi:hypothetical protein